MYLPIVRFDSFVSSSFQRQKLGKRCRVVSLLTTVETLRLISFLLDCTCEMHRSTIMVALALTLLCVLTEARSLQYQQQRRLVDAKLESIKRVLGLVDNDEDEYLQLLERLFTACSLYSSCYTTRR